MEAGIGAVYARVNNTSDGESARPQAQRLPRCVRSPAYWYSALIMRQSQASPFSRSAVTNNYQVDDNVNLVRGKHSLDIGFEWVHHSAVLRWLSFFSLCVKRSRRRSYPQGAML